MSEKRFKLINGVKKGTHSGIWDNRKQHNIGIGDELWVGEVVDKLNKQDEEMQRWKNLYKLKDAEVTARVDALNKVCEYYLTEAQFKSDTDPNDAVKEVINEILNTEVEMW